MKPRGIIVVMFVAAMTLMVLSEAGRGQFPAPRRFIGVAVLFAILGFAAEVTPQIAIPFAVFVVVALLLARGEEALLGLSREPKFKVVKGGKSA